MNRSKIKSTLLKSLEGAGRILKNGLDKPKSIQKKSELSIVTATDKAAEKLILKTILSAFPDHAILAEESAPKGRSGSRWIIDPLDGTSNFAHSYPVACVSIGFEHEGEILMGGVYDPYRDELFFAEKGKGATRNGKRIHVSKNKKLNDCLIATGFPYDRREKMDTYLPIFRSFLMKVQDLRRAGAAAIDLCYVACGRFDGYWEINLQPWDKAAGMLMIKEAGGMVTDFSNSPLTVTGNQNLASNGLIHKEMLSVLKPFKNAGK